MQIEVKRNFISKLKGEIKPTFFKVTGNQNVKGNQAFEISWAFQTAI